MNIDFQKNVEYNDLSWPSRYIMIIKNYRYKKLYRIILFLNNVIN